jgi:hypothetical protein
MNSYKKYCPNVFIAQCEEKHKKGDIITIETRYGKENEHIIHNFLYSKNGYFYYSITRADGFNSQERAKRKAEKLTNYASKREQKSNDYFKASEEGKEFLVMGEPIHVGHSSEHKHRTLLERNQKRFEKGIEENNKAKEYENKAEYWKSLENKIDLSMPESIEYFKFQLEKATKLHADLKAGKILKEHSYALPYAKKAVNENQKKYDLAIKLWG